MKTLLLALALLAPGLSQAAELKCHFGSDDQDNQVHVTLGQSRRVAVQIDFYESRLVASSNDIVKNGNTIAIVDKTLKYSGEGEESDEKVSALLVYNKEKKSMNLTVVLAGEVVAAATEMKCE